MAGRSTEEEYDAIVSLRLAYLLSVQVTHALTTISKRVEARVKELKNDKLLEAQRLAQRTNYDLEIT